MAFLANAQRTRFGLSGRSAVLFALNDSGVTAVTWERFTHVEEYRESFARIQPFAPSDRTVQ